MMALNKGRTALVTGASFGIGRELAKLLARDGFDLVLVARDEARLELLAAELRARYGIQADVLIQDLAEPDASAQIVARLQEADVHISILINNAGFGDFGAFARSDIEEQIRMLQVNIAALTILTRLLLPPMIACQRGQILNVASTAAFAPGPLMATYYASKAYVLSFSLALSNELKGSGVTVTTLCPGPTRTEFQKRAGLLRSKLADAAYMDASRVAWDGYKAMRRGQELVIPGARNRVFALGTRLFPARVIARGVRRVQEAK